MPIYTVEGPDKRTYSIEGPEGATIEQLVAVIEQQGSAFQAPKSSSFMGELKRGAEQLGSSFRTGIGAMFGTPEEAAEAGVARSREIAEKYGEGPSFERVKQTYETRGLLPAAGQAVSDIPQAVAGQAANIGAMLGGARIGAMAGAATPIPGGALVGGAIGAVAAIAPQLFGANVERQVEEQRARGEAPKVDMQAAALATAAQTGLEVGGTAFTLGKSLVKGVLGVTDDAALIASRNREQLLKTAQATVAGGAARGAAIEMPVEVAQAVLERAQAGLDLTSDDALKEYGENAYLAGLVGGPLGAVGRVSERSAARRALVEPEAPAAAAPVEPVVPPEPGAQGELFPTDAVQEAPAEPTQEERLTQLRQLRDEFDTLQRENERLRAANTEEARAEAEKIAPALTDLQAQIKEVQKGLPKEEVARPGPAPVTPVEGQYELPLDERIRTQDLPTYGVPVSGGTPSQTAVRGWMQDNVVGKTLEQVRGLTTRQPDLIKGEGLRARVLRSMLEPQPAAYVEPTLETPREPIVRAPAEQREIDLGRAEPSVAVPSEPAGVRGRASERVEPAREPAAAEPAGLAPAELPAGERVSVEEPQLPAVTTPPELREGTQKVLGDLWEDYKPENAPAFEKLPDYVQSQWFARVSESMKPGARGLSLSDTEKVFDKALENVGYELYNARMEPSKDAKGKVIQGLIFRTDRDGKVAQGIYEQLTPEARKVANDYADKYVRTQEKAKSARDAAEELEKALADQRQKEEFEDEQARAKAAPAAKPTRKERRKPLQRAETPAPAPAPAPEAKPEVKAKAEPTPKVSLIQGTPEQIKQAEAHAKDLGGKVVALEGDYGLVQGYAQGDGAPAYSVTFGKYRSTRDIDSYTDKEVPADVKIRLSSIKKQLEEDAAAKHAKDPFIKFGADGLALSKDIPAEYEGIIREWKKLLKLDVPIYVSTLEDAKKNKDNFTGPHRAIGSGLLNLNDAGSTRRMADGSRYILFTKSASKTKTLEILAHELGHVHQRVAFDNASPEEKRALYGAHEKWLKSLKGKTARDLVQSMRGRASQRFVEGDLSIPVDELNNYWRLFSEWYADQTARWALSADKPVTVVEKFFARIGAVLRKFYNGLKAKDYLPNETFANYIEAVIARPEAVSFAPDQVGSNEIASPMTTRVSSEELADFDKGFSPQPGGVARQMQEVTIDNITKFRRIAADKAATVFDQISKNFNNSVASALKDPSVETAYRQAEASNQLLPAVFREGVLRFNKAVKLWEAARVAGIKSAKDIFDDVAAWGEAQNLNAKQANARADELLRAAREHEFRRLNQTQEEGRSFPVSMSDEDIDRLYAEYQKDTKLQAIKQDMDKLRFDFIDQLVASGRITKEMGKDWKEATAYVPFDRMDDFSTKFRPQRRVGRGVSQLGNLPELVNAPGTNRAPKNVLENYVNLIGWMTRQVVQQNATLRTYRALEDIGQALPPRATPPADADRKVELFINGEVRYGVVASPYHVAAFRHDITPLPGMFKLMGQFSRVLRHAVTAVPTFTAAQLPMDIQRAIMASGVKDPIALAAKALGNFKAFAKAASLGKMEDMAPDLAKFGIVGGVDFTSSNPAESFLQDMGLKQREILKSSKFGNLIYRLDGVALASDIAVRKAIYDQTLEETTGDRALALQRAREIINFRRFGVGDRMGALHIATQTIPFFNAYLQGTDVLYRSLTGKGAPSGLLRNAALKQYWSNVGYLMGASVLYAMSMAGDDEYENMDLRERDRTWVLGGGIGIPVPSELGILFKAIPERVLEVYRKHGTPEQAVATEALLSWFKAAYEEFLGRQTPVPAAVKPLLENFTNFSFLTGRSLEGTFQQQQLASQRYTSRTSELAKQIAEFTANTSNVQVSPIDIDNALRGYLGTTAALVMAVADQAINPNRADRPLHQIVGLTAFTYDPVGTRRASEFYDLRERVVQTQNSLNQMMRNNPEKAFDFAQKNSALLSTYKAVNGTLEELEKTRAMKRFLDTEAAASTMTSEERMRMQQEIQAYEQQLVSWTRDAKNMLGI